MLTRYDYNISTFISGFRDTFRLQVGKGPYRAVAVKLTTFERSSNGPHDTVVMNTYVAGKAMSVKLWYIPRTMYCKDKGLL